MKVVRVALITLAAVSISNSVQSEPLKFNGARFKQIDAAQSTMSFRSQSDPVFVETITIRSIESNGKFDDVTRAFIARAKTESGGAKLLVMEKATTNELMVAYLKKLDHNKIIYNAERLSAPDRSSPISVAYSSEFEGDTSEMQDTKVKKTAMRALAVFDMDKARKLLSAER